LIGKKFESRIIIILLNSSHTERWEANYPSRS